MLSSLAVACASFVVRPEVRCSLALARVKPLGYFRPREVRATSRMFDVDV
jgi:hypothetical protein